MDIPVGDLGPGAVLWYHEVGNGLHVEGPRVGGGNRGFVVLDVVQDVSSADRSFGCMQPAGDSTQLSTSFGPHLMLRGWVGGSLPLPIPESEAAGR